LFVLAWQVLSLKIFRTQTDFKSFEKRIRADKNYFFLVTKTRNGSNKRSSLSESMGARRSLSDSRSPYWLLVLTNNTNSKKRYKVLITPEFRKATTPLAEKTADPFNEIELWGRKWHRTVL